MDKIKVTILNPTAISEAEKMMVCAARLTQRGHMEILAAVTARLSALGYTVTETDSAALDYNIKKAETTLKVRTNQLEVPEGLFYVWADMAAGMFLTDKKASGALSEVYDFDAPAKSISEGDTSVTFAIADTGSFEDQFDAMLAKMVNPDAELIAAFRRLVW